MNAVGGTGRFAALPEAPYVGMRPFERSERKIFCGRESEVALLANKVFAARLTVMYGPSGVGKSSLIRTLLLDQIERQDARVLYFEDWRGEDPTASLRQRLLETATQLGIADADKGDPTLVHLAQLLVGFDRRTLVVVLDQFEEFFTAHRADIEPFRSQLAALVHAQGVDLRLLISLREEHLAALEPFRSAILELFQSMFRLEPLSAADVRKAIVQPAAEFGVSYEEGLVEEIIADLATEESADAALTAAAAQAPTDLPLLQLVCQELWNHTHAAGQKLISKPLYQSLGRKKGIVSAYLARVMPTHWRRKQVTAQLMRHLAPPDGHKVALSADHLASVTELRRGVVKDELDRLAGADVRVLLTRAYERETLYELRHDSFVRVIAPWRNEVLRRARMQQWSMRAAGVAALVLIGIVAALWWVDRRDLHRNVYDVWQDAQRNDAQKFDHVASYLLWSRTGTGRLDLLRQQLIEHQAQLPSDYGWDRAGLQGITLPDRADWPLELDYSELRQLDQYAFTWRWQGQAQDFSRKWGIPVPSKLALAPRPEFSETRMEFRGAQIRPLDLDLPTDENRYLLSQSSLAEAGVAFLHLFKNEWTRFDDTEMNRDWYMVPRWSVPVWKASGANLQDGSSALAVRLISALQNNPDRLVTESAVKVLLDRAEGEYPQTVAEARAIRGPRLITDFQEVLRRGQSLNALPYLLDILANYPEGTSAEIAERVVKDVGAYSPDLPSKVMGPHPAAVAGESKAIHRAYQDAATWLPPIKLHTRVYIGAELVTGWVDADSQIDHSVLEALDRFQGEFERRYGITQPTANFYGATAADGPRAVRITVPAHDGDQGKLWSAAGGDSIEFLRSHYAFRAEFLRAHQVTADMASANMHLNRSLGEWLDARYSVTDIKSLLRGVIAPSAEEIKARAALVESERLGAIEVPVESSVRHTPWLLYSLAFWSKAHPSASLPQLVDDLRQMQRARTNPPAAASNPRVEPLINSGIDKLLVAAFPAAQVDFAGALRIDEKAAIDTFLRNFARTLRTSVMTGLENQCEDYAKARLPEMDRLDLEDYSRQDTFDGEVGPDKARRLRLCLLHSYGDSLIETRRTAAADIMKVSGPPATWEPREAAWFAHEALKTFDPTEQDRSVANATLEYTRSALARMSPRDGYYSFKAIVDDYCDTNGPVEWCWDLLTEIAQKRNRPETLIYMAASLAGSGSPDYARRSLKLLEQAKKAGNGADSGIDPVYLGEIASYAEASAILRSPETASPQSAALERADALFAKVSFSTSTFLASASKSSRAQIRNRLGRVEEAWALLDELKRDHPEVSQPYASSLMLALATADTRRVEEIAAEAWQRVTHDEQGQIKSDSTAMSFVGALGLLMSEGKGWERAAHEFLGTRHEYVPYVAMLLYSQMAGQSAGVAREVLKRRWVRAHPARWDVRVREGDVSAWREMLIGYYLGEVKRETVFGDLDDPAHYASSPLRHLPMSRDQLLCEAYFYDALLARSKKDKAAATRSLQRALGTQQHTMFEYAMAKYLLARGV